MVGGCAVLGSVEEPPPRTANISTTSPQRSLRRPGLVLTHHARMSRLTPTRNSRYTTSRLVVPARPSPSWRSLVSIPNRRRYARATAGPRWNPVEQANTSGRFPSGPGTTATATAADAVWFRDPNVWVSHPRVPRRKNGRASRPRRTIGRTNR